MNWRNNTDRPVLIMGALALAVLSTCAWKGIITNKVNASPAPVCAVKIEGEMKPKPDDRSISLGKAKALQLCGSMCT